MVGSSAPAPSTSQALSAPAAINGRPCGMPVCRLASALIWPSRSPGLNSSGNCSRRTASACHFQSRGAAQRRRL